MLKVNIFYSLLGKTTSNKCRHTGVDPHSLDVLERFPYKSINEQSLLYLKDLIVPCYLSVGLLVVPRVPRCKMGYKGFSHQPPLLWKKLRFKISSQKLALLLELGSL